MSLQVPEDQEIVVIGATGDLARRKLLPAHTLFARGDGVERAWTVVQPVLDAMPPVCLYPAGNWGPAEADELIAPRKWHLR